MYFSHKTYLAHDVDLFFTRKEIMQSISDLFENEFEAKKTFLNLFQSLKLFFSELPGVYLETPNPPSTGNMLFKLRIDNEESFNFILKVGEHIQESAFLDFFVECDKSIRIQNFNDQENKRLLVKNLKSYFLYQSFSDKLDDDKPKIKSKKI